MSWSLVGKNQVTGRKVFDNSTPFRMRTIANASSVTLMNAITPISNSLCLQAESRNSNFDLCAMENYSAFAETSEGIEQLSPILLPFDDTIHSSKCILAVSIEIRHCDLCTRPRDHFNTLRTGHFTPSIRRSDLSLCYLSLMLQAYKAMTFSAQGEAKELPKGLKNVDLRDRYAKC